MPGRLLEQEEGSLNYKITVIKGDGIGPEIIDQTITVLEAVSEKCGISFTFKEEMMGGCAIDKYGCRCRSPR